MSLARALALTTYRSARELDRRFPHRRVGPSGAAEASPVEAWLAAHGERFAARFDAERYATLSESIDLHDVDPSALSVPTLLVSFTTDLLTPPWLVDELVARAPGVTRHVTIESDFGHDAFLKESARVGEVLAGFLSVVQGREVAR